MADILDCVITKVGPEAEISKRILGAFEDRDYIYAFEILEEVCESNNKDYKECVNKYSTKKKRSKEQDKVHQIFKVVSPFTTLNTRNVEKELLI